MTTIFYVSKRLVKKNKEIKIYKFRSMVKDATSAKYQLKEKLSDLFKGGVRVPLLIVAGDNYYPKKNKINEFVG